MWLEGLVWVGVVEVVSLKVVNITATSEYREDI
jgi:hypothetical protein